MMRLLALAVAGVLVSIASTAKADGRLTSAALDAAEQKWRGAAQRNYSYTFAWSEFISPCPSFRLDMVVKRGTPVGGPDCQKYRRKFSTVPSLFRYLRGALRARNYEVTAEFHPVLGYPTKASVAWSDMDDDYFSFEVTEFRDGD